MHTGWALTVLCIHAHGSGQTRRPLRPRCSRKSRCSRNSTEAWRSDQTLSTVFTRNTRWPCWSHGARGTWRAWKEANSTARLSGTPGSSRLTRIAGLASISRWSRRTGSREHELSWAGHALLALWAWRSRRSINSRQTRRASRTDHTGGSLIVAHRIPWIYARRSCRARFSRISAIE